MSKPKIRRDFLVAVEGQPDWYQAVPEHAVKGRPALHVERVLEGSMGLTSHSWYEILYRVVPVSPGIKNDLTAAVAEQIVAQPARINEILPHLAGLELEERDLCLTADAQERLIELYGEEEYKSLMQNLDFLRGLPEGFFTDAERIAGIVAYTEILKNASVVLNDENLEPQAKQDQIRIQLSAVQPDHLLGMTYEYGMDLGDGPSSAYDDCGLFAEDIKAGFDTAGSLMRHWDEVGKTVSGKPCDSLIAGEGKRRQAFVRADFAVKKLT